MTLLPALQLRENQFFTCIAIIKRTRLGWSAHKQTRSTAERQDQAFHELSLLFQNDTIMTHKPAAAGQAPRPDHYVLSREAYADLCSVRDELRLFAAVTARQAERNPEVLVCRNTLAHCFDHLAQRVDSVVNPLADNVSE
jgi:hypothetical protein